MTGADHTQTDANEPNGIPAFAGMTKKSGDSSSAISKPTFFLIAGEASGDLLGARLMKAMRAKLGGEVRFVGIGGPMMQAEGIDLLFPHTEIMHFGIIEVLRHIPRLLKLIDETAQAILKEAPTALITIDSPDFNFRVARRVRAIAGTDIPLIHYVAPTVWAWRSGRARKIARFLDHLLAVLPFEPPYFTREGLACTFVGHSVVEGGADKGSNAIFRSKRGIPHDALVLTVLPGSRTSEVSSLLPVFRETVKILLAKYPKMHLVVPTVPHLKERVAAEVTKWGAHVHIVEGEADKFDAFAASRAALACSGTVALELALAKTPAVIAYKISPWIYRIFKPLIHVKYANLVNIMHDKTVVPELLQQDCVPARLAEAVDKLLTDPAARQEQIAGLEVTGEWLGQGKFVPSERAAETVLDVVKNGPKVNSEVKKLIRTFSSDKAPKVGTVLQVVPSLVTGGVERGTVETAAALVKAGWKAIVASSGGPMAAEVEKVGGIHVTLPLASKNPFTMWRNVARLSEVIARQKVDVIHARSRAPAWSAWRTARKTHTPLVTTFHNVYGHASTIKRFYNSVMGKGDRIIAISEFVGEHVLQTYNVPRHILTVIPRGVDIDSFDPAIVGTARIDALRKAWNIHEGTPVILMPGRLTRWKGQLDLIEALGHLRRRDFVCVIVGGGRDSPYGQEVNQALKEAGLESNTAIFDTCRDMPAAYRLANVTVVPSVRPEGFGRVVVEAQAMGTPVIATSHGGAKETVIQGQTGWLVPPGDTVALALAIDKALNLSPRERETMAARAITHIRAHFTTAAMTAKTLAIYRDLLQKRAY